MCASPAVLVKRYNITEHKELELQLATRQGDLLRYCLQICRSWMHVAICQLSVSVNVFVDLCLLCQLWIDGLCWYSCTSDTAFDVHQFAAALQECLFLCESKTQAPSDKQCDGLEQLGCQPSAVVPLIWALLDAVP